MMHKLSFTILKTHINLIFRTSKKKENFQWGIGNRCREGKYVLFLDYDRTPISWVRDELKYIMKEYNLSHFFLFETKRGIHCINLEKRDISSVIEIMSKTTCDQDYKNVPLQHAKKIWVLRGSQKKEETIKYLYLMRREFSLYPEVIRDLLSTPHKEYLKDRFKIPEKNFRNIGLWDGEKDLIMAYYFISEENN